MSDPPTHDRFDPKCILMGDDGSAPHCLPCTNISGKRMGWSALSQPSQSNRLDLRFVPYQTIFFLLLFISS